VLTPGDIAAKRAAIEADIDGTAVRWVTFARKDWTDYLAARDADLALHPPA
jgi:hypothetical protein